MPEGDTLHAAAVVVSAALAGKALARVAGTAPAMASPRLVGRTVVSVAGRGKHLGVHFDDGRVLVTHLRMTGAWHVYPAGARWRRPPHLARVILGVDALGNEPALTAVCFSAPVVRIVSEREAEARLAHLGPDVMTASFSAEDAVARLRVRGGDRSIAEALLDQSALAGIGNVYKSETLFAERVSPFARVGDLDDATLTRLAERAHLLMRRNLGPGRLRRTTDPFGAARYAVYRRARLPCPRCGYPVSRAYQGRPSRSTYYCSRCQRS